MKNAFTLFLICCFVQAVQAQDLSKLSYDEINALFAETYQKGDYNKALEYLHAGSAKAKAEFGDRDTIYANYISDMGFIYNTIGQYKKAEQLMLEVKDIRTKAFGKDHVQIALILNNLAQLYYSMGIHEKSELTYWEAINMNKRLFGEEHPEYATNLNNLAELYYAMGLYEKAEPLYMKATNIREKVLGKEDTDYAVSLNNLGSLYKVMGQYERAESFFAAGKNILEKVLGQEHPNVATSLNNLGSLYQAMGLYEKAEPLYIKAKNIRAKIFGEENINFATSLNNLGGLYQKMKQYDKAEPLLVQSQLIRTKALGLLHPKTARAAGVLASFYLEIGQNQKAELLFLQSLDIYKKIFGKQHPDIATALLSLARFYQQNEKIDTALSYAQQSIIANCAALDSSFVAWETLDKLDYFSDVQASESIKTLLYLLEFQHQKTGNKAILEQHYAVAQAAIRLNERIRNGFLGEGDKLSALATNNDFVLNAIKTGMILQKPNYQETLWGFAEMNKGILLMGAEKTERAYKFGNLPDSLYNKEKALQKKYNDIKAKLQEKRSPAAKDSLQIVLSGINKEIDDFQKMLKNEYPKYTAIRYENKSASVADIQAALDDKTALIAYVLGEASLYAFYVDKKSVTLSEYPVSADSLKANINTLHRLLSDYKSVTDAADKAYKDYTEIAHWAYQNTLQKSLANAAGIEHLVIIPDGELAHLPFEAFLVEKANGAGTYNDLHYLINDYKISYNYSATLWKENMASQKNNHNGEILGMAANYQSKLDSAKAELRLSVYRSLRDLLLPLPSARQEVEMIANNFSGYFAFDSAATESTFKAKAASYGIIHLAMHGILDKKSPILSSLAFTEDGDSMENNFLQSYEISQMQLNADLVVLSACETGFGKFEKGNGTASLARAFMYAGVPAMVVSLWEVNDASTSTIMQSFYQHLSSGMPKDAALRQAKLDYIRTAKGLSAHPAFWSPFVQIGDARAVQVAVRGSKTWIWWTVGGGLVLLLGLLFARFRRKK